MKHIVEQGEHLASIAKKFGFADYRTIWNDGGNAGLRDARKSPNVLFPGDVVTIPDRQEKQLPRPTGANHRFVTTAAPLQLRIRVLDSDGKPDKDAPCVLNVDGISRNHTTDRDGKIKEEIPRDAKNGMLTIDDTELPLMIGHLDPVEKTTGQQARLNNLGYSAGPVGEDRPLQFRSAVEEFQCDQGMKVTGDMDAATRARLEKVHGC